MSTEPTQTHTNFCGDCGTRLTGSRFCPGCGTEVSAADAAAPVSRLHTDDPASAATAAHGTAPAPRREPLAHPSQGAPGGRSKAPLIAGLLLALVVVGVVAAVLLSSGGSDSEQTAYQQQVASTFGPVLGANRDLSEELSRIRGTRPLDARAAARRATEATTRAEGALSAMTVPEDGEQLATDARQVLDREKAYLGAVTAVLANPSSPNRSQLETLASNLSSAFSEAGASVAGEDPGVSGAAELTAWAPKAARSLKRKAAAKDDAREDAGGAAATAPAANPYANGQSCGGGLYAGPNTSCAFAESVRNAYNQAPGLTATVRAFSPTTGQTYTMNCAPSGDGITCSGGNNASVTF